MDNWYDIYKDYKEQGLLHLDQDNPSDNWDETWLREINEFDDYWYEYNAGLSDYMQMIS